MCEYKSMIVLRPTEDQPARILFYEDDSHEDLIRRAKLRDGERHIRRFVRVECRPPHDTVLVDEHNTPGWYDDNRADIETRVIELALTLAPLDADYRSKRDALDAEHESKHDALYADYRSKRDALDAEHLEALSKIAGYVPAL